MDIERYRFGSGSRPVASASSNSVAGPSRSNAEARKVNDLLGKLRLEQGRHRRNVLDKEFKASRNVQSEESDYETINQVVHRFGHTESIPSTGFLSSKSGQQGRRRTPGPKAPESWRDLNAIQSAEVSTADPSESLSRYGNGRRWSRERRVVIYALWVKTTLECDVQLDGRTLPTGLHRDSDKLGVQSMASYCLKIIGSHLDRTRGEGRSWLTTNEGKVALGKRFRGPLMVHAAMDGQSGWQGFLDLFDHTPAPPRSIAIGDDTPTDDKDWDETSSEEDEGKAKGPKAPAMSMLDLSFVPLPSPARLRIRELLQDPLAVSNLTSISFAGSGLALGDVVDMICQRESSDGEENRMRKKGTLHLRLTDLNLAGIGARDETEARSALETIGDTFQHLLFLDLSYTRTFPSYDGLQMLHTLYTFPEKGNERSQNLEVLGFRQMISHEQLKKVAVRSSTGHHSGKSVILSGCDCYVVARTTAKTSLLNHRRVRMGKYLEVVLHRQFETL